MQLTDFERFKSIMAGMGRLYSFDIDGVILDVYWLALKDWDLADFEAAAGRLMAVETFMPKPAAFTALRKAGEPTSGEAFERARAIVRRLPPREMISHQSGDPRLDAAVRACGGYEALAMCTTENIGFFERRFAEHFEAISDADDTRSALPYLTRKPEFRVTGPQSMRGLMASLEDKFEPLPP